MKTIMRKQARIWVSPELIINSLHMPEGTEIIYAETVNQSGDIEFVVSHDDLREVELAEGEKPPLLVPLVTRKPETITWHWYGPYDRLVNAAAGLPNTDEAADLYNDPGFVKSDL